MDDDRLSDILDNWRHWHQDPDLRIGWPRRSTPFEPGGTREHVNLDGGWAVPQSEAYAAVDEREARIVQAVVDDLPHPEQAAVYNAVLGSRRALIEPLEVVYARARVLLRARLIARGIVG